jgi:hypothetical protein
MMGQSRAAFGHRFKKEYSRTSGEDGLRQLSQVIVQAIVGGDKAVAEKKHCFQRWSIADVSVFFGKKPPQTQDRRRENHEERDKEISDAQSSRPPIFPSILGSGAR